MHGSRTGFESQYLNPRNKTQFQSPNEPKRAQTSPKPIFPVKNRVFGQNQETPFFRSKSTNTRFTAKIDPNHFFWPKSTKTTFVGQKPGFWPKSTKPRFLVKPSFFQSKSTKTTFFGHNRPKPLFPVKLDQNHPKPSPFSSVLILSLD